MNKIFSYSHILILVFTLLFTSNVSAAASITHVKRKGDLKPTHDLKCITLEQVKAKYTPADLSLAMYDCAINENFKDASNLYAFLIAYGAYDGKRVSDRTAHQAVRVLLLQFGNKLKEKSPSLVEQLAVFHQGVVKSKQFNNKICESASKIGPPDYHPNYMIMHGMKAFSKPTGNGLVSKFDGERAWSEIVNKMFNCA